MCRAKTPGGRPRLRPEAIQAAVMPSRPKSSHQMQDQSEVEAFLSFAGAYGLSTGVERIDTHAAMVFLAGGSAYKVKRAVKYPYLDFSSLARRHEACLHEVELNRRTAPDLYLGVTAVRRDPLGQLYLDSIRRNGEAGPPSDRQSDAVVEWVVEMKRFDPDDTLDHLASRNALTDGLLNDLARTIAAFHERAEPRLSGYDSAAGFREIIRGNDLAFEEYEGLFPRARSLEVTKRSLELLDGHVPLLARRQAAGRVRHCHGDLHLANIVKIDGHPVLFDAIEFDDRIAIIDVFYDLAFLLMDLWERDRKREANFVFNRYLSVTGDDTPLPLNPLFLSIRAAIRAKVSAAQYRPREAAHYFRSAERFLRKTHPQCVVIGGLSGSGKTTLAKALAAFVGAAPGAVHLRSDVIRKEIFGAEETDRLPASAYGRDVGVQVYETMMQRTRSVLEKGHSVIVDAVFAAEAERRAIEAVASELGVEPQCFWLFAAKDVMIGRVVSRRHDASDATPAVIEQQMTYDLGSLTWRQVSSDLALEGLVGRVSEMIRREPGSE
jgi:hypothetical protein